VTTSFIPKPVYCAICSTPLYRAAEKSYIRDHVRWDEATQTLHHQCGHCGYRWSTKPFGDRVVRPDIRYGRPLWAWERTRESGPDNIVTFDDAN
jgi:DNA-directed RNA polymerase subunit RPC12/RpoP